MLNRFSLKTDFRKNVLTLLLGTTLAQAIPIAISPILTRIYTPKDFGVLALYMSLSSLLSIIATGRYELAIMLPRKDEDAVNLVVVSILISFLVSSISLIIIVIFNEKITTLLGDPNLSNWLYFIPVTVLLTGLYQVFNYWSSRRKQYRQLSICYVIQSGTTSVSKVSMGVGGFGVSGLILGNVLGQMVSAIVLGNTIWKKDKNRLANIKRVKIIALIKEYKNFPIYNLPNAVIDKFRLSGIMILIAKFFLTSTLGQFSLAWRILQTPVSLVGGSLFQVFFQKTSVAKKSDLYHLVINFIIKASAIALPIFLIVYFFSESIFSFVFGENWSMAGKVASILAPWLFFNFITSPISTIFLILNRQNVLLILSVFYMIVPLSIIILLRDSNFISVLTIIAPSMSAILLVFIGMVIYYTKKECK